MLITATPAREPLVRGEWLHEGQHVTAVGADDPTKCELDAVALKRARVFVDSFETNAANGDIYRAIGAGDYAAADVSGEIGQVLLGGRARACLRHRYDDCQARGDWRVDLVAAEISLQKIGAMP